MNSFRPETDALQAISVALEFAPRIMFVCDVDGEILVANRAARKRCAIHPLDRLSDCSDTPEAHIRQRLRAAIGSSQAIPTRLALGDCEQGFQFWRIDPLPGFDRPLVMVKSDPETSLAARLVSVSDQYEIDRKKLKVAQSERDRLHKQARRLERLADTDRMTGLFNAVAFEKRCKTALWKANYTGGLAYIDLDDFKPINDRYGHDAGDFVIRTVAQRLVAATRHGDVVARLGGDEFGIWLKGLDASNLARLINRFKKTVEAPLDWVPQNQSGVTQLHVHMSIGVAIAPDDGQRFSNLKSCADKRMYASKAAGKQRA